MPQNTPPTLTITDLGKRYRRDFWGLRNFTLDLKPGITGLLGPNGAGKSTLMRMLATITRPTEGSIFWQKTNVLKTPNPVRKVLGYLPQDFGVYPHLNAYEFLHYLAAIKGLPTKAAKSRIEELLTWVNLRDAAKRPLGSYSGGMRQRIGIAQALLNDPLLLIVDEPTVGLDPEERVRFRQLLSDLAGDRIILFSTHIVSDVEATASRIVLMNQGRLLRDATPSALISGLKGKVWELETMPEQLGAYKQKFRVTASLHRSDHLNLRIVHPEKPAENAVPAAPTLEDVYLANIQNGTGA